MSGPVFPYSSERKTGRTASKETAEWGSPPNGWNPLKLGISVSPLSPARPEAKIISCVKTMDTSNLWKHSSAVLSISAMVLALAILLPSPGLGAETPKGEIGYLRSATSIPAAIGGRVAGHVTLQPGSKIDVVRREGDKALISNHADSAWVPAVEIAEAPLTAAEIKAAKTGAPGTNPSGSLAKPEQTSGALSGNGYIIPQVKVPYQKGGRIYYEMLPSGTQIGLVRAEGDKTLIEARIPMWVQGNSADKVEGACQTWIPSEEVSQRAPAEKTDRMVVASIESAGPSHAELRAGASIHQIIEWVKTNSPVIQRDLEREKKGRYAKLVPPSQALREMVPVTGPEEVSMRAEIERLGFVPRKQTPGLDVCALHSVANAIEILDRKAGKAERPSLAYLRWIAPASPKNPGADDSNVAAGVSIRGLGVCSEKDFPLSKIGSTPSAEIQALAKSRRGLKMHGIFESEPCPVPGPFRHGWPYDGDEIANQIVMHEIKNGRPVIVSCGLPKKLGPKEVIDYDNWSGGYGPHAALIVGFRTKDGSYDQTYYEIVNSWGPGWGDKGYAWCAARYLLGTRLFSLSLE